MIKSFPKVTLKEDYSLDKKQEMETFLNSVYQEPANEYLYYEIRAKKEDFFNWLKLKHLFYLIEDLNHLEPLTDLEWRCRIDILNILRKLDLYMIQCKNQDKREISPFVKEKMKEFNKDYV